MRKIIIAILRVLDGAPRSATRMGQAGQSLVELAFITPLLAIMIVGIVEIGWYANHFLIMLEVTKIGARSGTVLTSGELSPLNWNEEASVHPVVYRDGYLEPVTKVPQLARSFRDCSSVDGFFEFIACRMLISFEPQVFKGNVQQGGKIGYRYSDPDDDDNNEIVKTITDRYGNVTGTIPYPDDIVVSVFAFQAVNNNNPSTLKPPNLTPPNPNSDKRQFALYSSFYAKTYNLTALGVLNPDGTSLSPGSQVILVGRYPKLANECNVFVNPTTGVRVTDTSSDPFDYIRNNQRDTVSITSQTGIVQRPIELVGRDPITGTQASNEGSPEYPEPREFQLGFVWTAQHKRTDITNANGTALCWGSEWDNAEVLRFMNLPNFVDPDTAGVRPWNQQRAALTSQGVVWVEMYWQHSILLDFPFIRPIVAMFGDTNNIVISAWAAFPAPAAEPNIVYGLP
jgi:hypothetical protein